MVQSLQVAPSRAVLQMPSHLPLKQFEQVPPAGIIPLLQSVGQVVQVSPWLQVPSPHLALVCLGQSAGQLVQSSVGEPAHIPLPQYSPVW